MKTFLSTLGLGEEQVERGVCKERMKIIGGNRLGVEFARRKVDRGKSVIKAVDPRVQGNAFGGGIGMMAVCDVCIGVTDAKFGLTEVKLGLIPATISPYVLARMGEDKARRVFMSARLFGAHEAVSLNLLARIVAAEDLDAAIAAEVAPYLLAAPGAVAESKRLTRMLGPQITPEIIDATIDRLVGAWEGDEAPEGIAAFFEKRKPRWQA